MTTYRVVLEGKVMPGFDPEAVRPKLASLTKSSDEVAGRFLSGKLSTVKHGVDQATGLRYVEALCGIGVACRIEPETLGMEINADPSPTEPVTKACPLCGEEILAVAKKCKHCGSMLDGSDAITRDVVGRGVDPFAVLHTEIQGKKRGGLTVIGYLGIGLGIAMIAVAVSLPTVPVTAKPLLLILTGVFFIFACYLWARENTSSALAPAHPGGAVVPGMKAGRKWLLGILWFLVVLAVLRAMMPNP